MPSIERLAINLELAKALLKTVCTGSARERVKSPIKYLIKVPNEDEASQYAQRFEETYRVP